MRTVIIIALLLSFTALKAQTYLPGGFIDYNYRGSLMNNQHLNDSTLQKKWFVSKYSGMSTSFSFFKGGNATVVSAPIGLQLNRRLNNNLYAFAGVSIAPAYINFNQSFISNDFNKSNAMNGFNSKSLGLYSRAELGLQYINDDRTLSISGSIGIERNSYPIYNQTNNTRQNRVMPATW